MISKKSKLGKGLIEIEKLLDQMPDWMKDIYNYKQTKSNEKRRATKKN